MNKKIRKKLNLVVKTLPLSIVVFAAFTLRVINLGYSDYQGDEIKAFLRPAENQSAVDFLLNQRKGPGQFIITSFTELFNTNYENEFLTRIPFALAGAFAVYFFYKLLRQHFGDKVAFFASLFFATNGFLVALSRIAQYQAFVILFMILALYMFSNKKLYHGFIFWAFSMLFHYDGLFIAPFALYLIFSNKPKIKIKDLIKPVLISGVILAVFYIPFIVNISQKTLEYWGGRVTGDVSSKISSSKYLFTVYQPIYVVHFYTILAFVGFGAFIMSKFVHKFPKIADFSVEKKTWVKFVYIFLWFFIPFVFLEGLIYIPGTHIYTYLIPLFVFLGLALEFGWLVLKRFKDFFIPEVIYGFSLIIMFSFIYLQSYAIFVDNKKEYPWESEEFLVWEFHQPTPIYHLSMFGFPYYRNWEGIGEAVMTGDHNGYYSTNERKSIARYYVPLEKSTDDAGHYIHILNSQSFTDKIQQEKAAYWAQRYNPIYTYSRNGQDLVRVYKMEPGTIYEIQDRGY
ncbi:glycosyltransferase family 39 protein [Patescibacteria group bacterium]